MNNSKVYSQTDLVTQNSNFWGDADFSNVREEDEMECMFFTNNEEDTEEEEEDDDDMKCMFFN